MILGVIPARAGSKGIPHKNTKLLAGLPLIFHTTEAADQSYLDDWVISTNDTLIKMMYQNKIVIRPPELAQDDTPMIPVLQHVLNNYKKPIEAIMLLQPTSPLRTSEDINNCLSLYDGRPLYSGYYMGIKTKDRVYDKTQEKHFQRNGAIFIIPVELIKQGKLWDSSVIEYEMPLSRSIDIDTMDDWEIAEALIGR
jgi:CMP-N-acetylneuraminic acid synthetase